MWATIIFFLIEKEDQNLKLFEEIRHITPHQYGQQLNILNIDKQLNSTTKF